MATITMREISELADPKLRKVAKRVAQEMELAIAKTVAHQAEPANYPLPEDRDSVEQIVQERFQQLRPEQQQFAVARLMPRVNAANAARQKGIGSLAKIDLHSAIPVVEQAKAISLPASLKLTSANLQSFINTPPLDGGIVSQQSLDNLELRIHRVACIDETGRDFNPFGDEPGSDEIHLSGTTVDESGDTKKVAAFKVANFDDGDVKNFSPLKRFTVFNLREGTKFPKSYFVTLVLAEADEGGLGDFVNKLLEKVREQVIAALTAAFGGAIGSSGGPVGAVIGAAIGFVVGKVFEFLRSVFADDIFPPKTVSVDISSLSDRFAGRKTDSPQATIRFAGHNGTYDVTYDWRLFA